MTPSSRLARLLPPLVAELSAFAAVGRLLVLTPLVHTVRAVLLERTSSPTEFNVRVLVHPLSIPSARLMLSVGWEVLKPDGPWRVDDVFVGDKLLTCLQRDPVPFLRTMVSARDVALGVKARVPQHDAMVTLAIAHSFATHGDVPQAVRELARFIDVYREHGGTGEPSFHDAVKLKSLLEKEPTKARVQLETWERATVQALGLNGLYVGRREWPVG